MGAVYFFGRFHVLILHLPITLILVVGGLEWLNRRHGRPDLNPALRILWAATAMTAVATVVLGYMHFAEGGFTGPSAEHQLGNLELRLLALSPRWDAVHAGSGCGAVYREPGGHQ